MKKRKTNKKLKMDKFDLFVILTSMFTLGMLIEKISIYGIDWIITVYR